MYEQADVSMRARLLQNCRRRCRCAQGGGGEPDRPVSRPLVWAEERKIVLVGTCEERELFPCSAPAGSRPGGLLYRSGPFIHISFASSLSA